MSLIAAAFSAEQLAAMNPQARADDPHGVRSITEIGIDNVTYETDYPHSDSTWPHSLKIAQEQTVGLPDDIVYKVLRGNAIEMLSLDHLR